MPNQSNQQPFPEQGTHASLPTNQSRDGSSWISCDTLDECTLVIPVDDLNKPLTLHAPEFTALRRIIFLNPHSFQVFQHEINNLDFRIIQNLRKFNSPSVEHITLPLDFSFPLRAIFRCISSFSGLREIELLPPTTFSLLPHAPETKPIQQTLSANMGQLNHLRTLTIPLEVITPLLLSRLGELPNLGVLIVKPHLSSSSPPASSLSPDWNPHDPVTSPGRRFLSHFQNWDTSRYFRALGILDVGVRDPYDVLSYSALSQMFPTAIIL
ncbi:hypothetical protein BYT27DRAFT_7187957 [Phlegmacium glaucopus]|nr:hypothetical protein BYT27DRAFT_7187957 [Phlegmacium glaucopus]